MNNETLQNHKRYLERVDFYRRFGYDLEKERDFILEESLPVFGEILEIGTGKGHFALTLAKRGFRFVTVDVSAQDQAIAQLNIRYFGLEKRVDFRIENARNLSFPAASFDVIFSVNVFHHLKKPDEILNETMRVLNTSGKIILSDFTDKGLEIINACHSYEGRKHDYFRHRLDEARDYFSNKGFSVKESQSIFQQVLIAQRN